MGGRGSRRGGWGERPSGRPAADPGGAPPSGAAAGVDDLFVLGLFDSIVSDADWQAWQEAVGPARADGSLSPLVSGRFSPVLQRAAGAGPGGARGPRSPRLPPGDGRLGVEEVFTVLQDPVLATRTPGVAISACVADGPTQQQKQQQQQQQQQEHWRDRGPPNGWNQAAAGRGPASGPQQQQQHGTPSQQPQQHPPPTPQQQQQQQYPDSWEQPGPDFEAFVSEAVKHRLGKYVQPDHPSRITKEEAQQLYKKLRRQIVDKELAACAERRAAGAVKPIERSKLEANIKEFVRASIRRLHSARPGAGSGQHAGGPHHAAPGSGKHAGVNGFGQNLPGAYMAA